MKCKMLLPLLYLYQSMKNLTANSVHNIAGDNIDIACMKGDYKTLTSYARNLTPSTHRT